MVYRTGRNKVFSVKTDLATADAFYAIAQENGWKAAETFEKALPHSSVNWPVNNLFEQPNHGNLFCSTGEGRGAVLMFLQGPVEGGTVDGQPRPRVCHAGLRPLRPIPDTTTHAA